MRRSASGLAVFVGIGCTAFFAGCGGGEESPPTDAAAAPPSVPAPARVSAGVATRRAVDPKPKKKPEPQPDPEPTDFNKLAANATVADYVISDPVEYDVETEASPETQFYAVAPPAGFVSGRLYGVPGETPGVALPEGFTALPGPATEDGLPTQIRSAVDSMTMRLVPEGPFPRGSNDGPENTRPERPVFVSAFYVDEHEVTVGQYREFLEASPKLKYQAPSNSGLGDDQPAVGVTWREATAYAEWAGKRLLTEAEWEKAARGPSGLVNVWGTGRPLWHTDYRAGEIGPVAAEGQDRSPFGVFGMAGNVREWTSDWYDPAEYGRGADDVIQDPTGPRRPRVKNARVVRGQADGFSVIVREGESMSSRDPLIGFRCAISAEELLPQSSRPERAGRGDDEAGRRRN